MSLRRFFPSVAAIKLGIFLRAFKSPPGRSICPGAPNLAPVLTLLKVGQTVLVRQLPVPRAMRLRLALSGVACQLSRAIETDTVTENISPLKARWYKS